MMSSLPVGNGILIIHYMHDSSATTSACDEVSAEASALGAPGTWAALEFYGSNDACKG